MHPLSVLTIEKRPVEKDGALLYVKAGSELLATFTCDHQSDAHGEGRDSRGQCAELSLIHI